MNKNIQKITALVMFAILGIVTIVGVGIPIFDDMTEIAKTATNDNTIRYSLASDERQHVIEYDNTEKILYIDDVAMNESGVIGNGVVFWAGDALISARENYNYELWIAGDAMRGNDWTLTFTGKEYTTERTYSGNVITESGTFASTPMFWNQNGDYGTSSSVTISGTDEPVAMFRAGGTLEATYIANTQLTTIGNIDQATSYATPSADNSYTPVAGSTYDVTTVQTTNDNGTVTVSASMTIDGTQTNLVILAPITYSWLENNPAADVISLIPLLLIMILLIGVSYGLMSLVRSGRSEL